MLNVRKRPREQITGDDMERAASQAASQALYQQSSHKRAEDRGGDWCRGGSLDGSMDQARPEYGSSGSGALNSTAARGNLSKNDLSEIQLIQQFIMENDLFDGDDEENTTEQQQPILSTRSSTPLLEMAVKAPSTLVPAAEITSALTFPKHPEPRLLDAAGQIQLDHHYMDVDTNTTNNIINYNDLDSFDDCYDDPGIDDQALVALEMQASQYYFTGADEAAAAAAIGNEKNRGASVIPAFNGRPLQEQHQPSLIDLENSVPEPFLSVGLTNSQKECLSKQDNVYKVKLELSTLQASKAQVEQELLQKKGECKFAREKMQKLERENAGLHNKLAQQTAIFSRQAAGEKEDLNRKLAESQDAWRNAMDELRSVKTKLLLEQKKVVSGLVGNPSSSSSSSVLRPVVFPKASLLSNSSSSSTTRPSTKATTNSVKSNKISPATYTSTFKSSIGINTDPFALSDAPLFLDPNTHTNADIKFTKSLAAASSSSTPFSLLTTPLLSPLSLLSPNLQASLYSFHTSTVLCLLQTQNCGSLLFPALWTLVPLQFHADADRLKNTEPMTLDLETGLSLHYVLRTLRLCMITHHSSLCAFLFEQEGSGRGSDENGVDWACQGETRVSKGLEYVKSLSILFSFVGDWMMGSQSPSSFSCSRSSSMQLLHQTSEEVGEVGTVIDDDQMLMQELVVHISNELFKILWSCCFYACDSASCMLSLSFLGSDQMRLLLDCGVEGLDYTSLIQISSLVLQDDFLGPQLVWGQDRVSPDIQQTVISRSTSSSTTISSNNTDPGSKSLGLDGGGHGTFSLKRGLVQHPSTSVFTIFASLLCTVLSSLVAAKKKSLERKGSGGGDGVDFGSGESLDPAGGSSSLFEVCVLIGETMEANLTRYSSCFLKKEVEIVHCLITALYSLVGMVQSSQDWHADLVPRLTVQVLKLLWSVLTCGDSTAISLDLGYMSKLLTSLTRLAQPILEEEGEGGEVEGGDGDDLFSRASTGIQQQRYLNIQQINKLAVDMLSLFDN